MNFIDIHGHYAWDVDDGIPTKEDAYQALLLAKQNHITSIVATPHVVCGMHNQNDISHILSRIQELKDMGNNLGINIYSGCELFLNHDCIESLHHNHFIPIENTHYLLVEFDVRKELGDEDEVEDYLHEIEILGYTPIIAHVERYFKKEIDIDRVRDFIDNGYIIQVNATSLLGVHGKTTKKNAYTLLDNGLIHVIASDTHRCTGHRIPCLLDVYDLISKKYDYHILKTLMFDNPQHILNNEDVELIQVKKSFFKNLFQRR